MHINLSRREMNLKVVYYGPPLSGKTTNLVRIHEFADPSVRGELISLATAEDRTLYFDFLRVDLRRINGLKPRVHLYTVPGQPQYEASRRMVWPGADGVVFVADSAADRLDENLRAWQDLKRHLEELDQAGSTPTSGNPRSLLIAATSRNMISWTFDEKNRPESSTTKAKVGVRGITETEPPARPMEWNWLFPKDPAIFPGWP